MCQDILKGLLDKAREIDKVSGDAMAKAALAEVVAAGENLKQILEPKRTSASASWRSALSANPTWKEYARVAGDTVCTLNPKAVQPVLKGVVDAVEKYNEVVQSFAIAPQKNIIDQSVAATVEAKACLIAVSILQKPSQDKVVQHRALAAQLKQAHDPTLAGYIDKVLLVQLKKATSFG